MINSRPFGDARLSVVREYYGPSHPPRSLLPTIDSEVLEANRHWLDPSFWMPKVNRFVIALQTWLLEVDDKVILIDTGVGNNKNRPGFDRLHGLNTQFLNWLEAAGAPAETVTHVVCTHLHPDHVGWNTSLKNGEWVPTFPNAKYLVPAECLAYVKELYRKDPSHGYSMAYWDSIAPVESLGMLETFEDDDIVAGILEAEPAPGHMPGQVSFHFESQGRHAMFCGDTLHHPIQVLKPEWSSSYDTDPDEARRTRKAILKLAAGRDALLLPAHFGMPNCGYVRHASSGFAFMPSEWSE